MTSRVTYPGDGTLYAIPFPYLDLTHVKVKVDNVELDTDEYSFPTSGTVQLDTDPGDADVMVYRETPEEPLTVYQSGSVLSRNDLEVDSLQALYRIEEVADTVPDFPDELVAGAVPMVDANGTGFVWAAPGDSEAALTALALPTGAGLVGFDDPVAPTYLKTVSDIINGDQVSLHRFIDPTKLSAIRASTSTYDASDDVQDGLDVARDTTNGLKLYVPHGTILAKNLLMYGNTSLDGESPASVFKLPEGVGTTDKILRNANYGAYTDFNLSIRGLTFDGNDAGAGETQTRLSELVGFGRVINLRWTDNIIQNVQYIGLGLGGVHRARITNSQFALCGYDGETENGGPACWIANSGIDQSEDIVFTHNQVHANRWTGVHFSVMRGSIIGNAFYDNQENHIFGSRLASANIEMSDVAIVGNSLVKVRRRHISSHAIEVGGLRLAIAGNVIRDCDHGGIALTDSQHSTITGNTIGNFNNLGVALGSGIDLICSETGANAVTDITVTGNTIYDDRASVLGRAGVHVYNGGGDAPTNITIIGNPMNKAWTSGKGVLVGAGMMGAGFVSRNNPGNDDSARGCTVWQDTDQTLANSAATGTAVTFDTASINSESFVDGEGPMWEAANPTRITAREPGRWKVTGGVGFAANGTGSREIFLQFNGAGGVGLARVFSETSPAAHTHQLNLASAVIDVAAGDYVEMFARQDSGGDLAISGSAARTWLSVEVL